MSKLFFVPVQALSRFEIWDNPVVTHVCPSCPVSRLFLKSL